MGFSRKARRRPRPVAIVTFDKSDQAEPILTLDVEGFEHRDGRKFARTRCPWCHAVVLIDLKAEQTFHQQPTCDAYVQFCESHGAKKVADEYLPGADKRGQA